MIKYSLALEEFEEKIGYRIDENFEKKFSKSSNLEHALLLIRLLNSWRDNFVDILSTSDTLPLSIAEDNTYLVKRSCLYSSNYVLHGGGTVVDEWYNLINIPNHYIRLLANYHHLIRANICCIVPDAYQRICSQDDLADDIKFSPAEHRCAAVTSQNRLFTEDTPTDNIHFKFFLPDIRGVEFNELITLVNNEEIFLQYHNVLPQTESNIFSQ